MLIEIDPLVQIVKEWAQDFVSNWKLSLDESLNTRMTRDYTIISLLAESTTNSDPPRHPKSSSLSSLINISQLEASLEKVPITMWSVALRLLSIFSRDACCLFWHQFSLNIDSFIQNQKQIGEKEISSLTRLAQWKIKNWNMLLSNTQTSLDKISSLSTQYINNVHVPLSFLYDGWNAALWTTDPLELTKPLLPFKSFADDSTLSDASDGGGDSTLVSTTTCWYSSSRNYISILSSNLQQAMVILERMKAQNENGSSVSTNKNPKDSSVTAQTTFERIFSSKSQVSNAWKSLSATLMSFDNKNVENLPPATTETIFPSLTTISKLEEWTKRECPLGLSILILQVKSKPVQLLSLCSIWSNRCILGLIQTCAKLTTSRKIPRAHRLKMISLSTAFGLRLATQLSILERSFSGIYADLYPRLIQKWTEFPFLQNDNLEFENEGPQKENVGGNSLFSSIRLPWTDLQSVLHNSADKIKSQAQDPQDSHKSETANQNETKIELGFDNAVQTIESLNAALLETLTIDSSVVLSFCKSFWYFLYVFHYLAENGYPLSELEKKQQEDEDEDDGDQSEDQSDRGEFAITGGGDDSTSTMQPPSDITQEDITEMLDDAMADGFEQQSKDDTSGMDAEFDDSSAVTQDGDFDNQEEEEEDSSNIQDTMADDNDNQTQNDQTTSTQDRDSGNMPPEEEEDNHDLDLDLDETEQGDQSEQQQDQNTDPIDSKSTDETPLDSTDSTNQLESSETSELSTEQTQNENENENENEHTKETEEEEGENQTEQNDANFENEDPDIPDPFDPSAEFENPLDPDSSEFDNIDTIDFNAEQDDGENENGDDFNNPLDQSDNDLGLDAQNENDPQNPQDGDEEEESGGDMDNDEGVDGASDDDLDPGEMLEGAQPEAVEDNDDGLEPIQTNEQESLASDAQPDNAQENLNSDYGVGTTESKSENSATNADNNQNQNPEDAAQSGTQSGDQSGGSLDTLNEEEEEEVADLLSDTQSTDGQNEAPNETETDDAHPKLDTEEDVMDIEEETQNDTKDANSPENNNESPQEEKPIHTKSESKRPKTKVKSQQQLQNPELLERDNRISFDPQFAAPSSLIQDEEEEETSTHQETTENLEPEPEEKLPEPVVDPLVHPSFDSLDSNDGFSHESSAFISTSAAHLCSRLRLILEPTVCSKLVGNFKTGKRLNIKALIPFIASNYKRDRIWLRRDRPAKRNYQVLLCIDDSKSMEEYDAGVNAKTSLCVLARALSTLAVGEIGVISFGKEAKLVHPLSPFWSTGSESIVSNSLLFDQSETNIKNCLELVLDTLASSSVSLSHQKVVRENVQLVFIISDGRFSGRDTELTKLIHTCQERRHMVVFLMLDSNTENSVYDLRSASVENGKVKMKYYLDDFAFPYYSVVQDMNDLPNIVGDIVAQWFASFVNVKN